MFSIARQAFSLPSSSCFIPWEAELCKPHKQDPVPSAFWLSLASGEPLKRPRELEENEVKIIIFPIPSLLGCLWLAVSFIRRRYSSQIYLLSMSLSFESTAPSLSPFKSRGGDSFAHIAKDLSFFLGLLSFLFCVVSLCSPPCK